MADADFMLALQLQEQFDNEVSGSVWNDDNSDRYPLNKKRKVDTSDWGVDSYSRPVQPERPLSIVDESWEMLDPNPDVRAMFLQFNDMFFWGKLCGVEVKWSPRMTLCAGVCSYEGRGGLCSIRLSEPLLKLRPRKDLVETLLHEMIHALLFVTQNNRDRDGHGPEFCKHMDRINQASGTKISIYHSFHDEVDVYRQHWWRCNGPCQNRKPFFGYVKRAMNRAPSARDPWWEEHRRTCGGTYTKIKEPENYGKKGKSEEKKDKHVSKKPADKPGGKPAGSPSGSQDIRNIIPFSGRGFVLGGSTQPSASIQKPPMPSPTHSPKPPQEPTPSSPADIRPHSGATTLPKRSVSNHKAFVNINGSPVRVTKTNSSLMRPKQTTVQNLFQNRNLKSPKKTNPTELNSAKTSPNSKSSSHTSAAGSPFSKYFSSAKSASGISGQINTENSSGFSSKSSAAGSSGSTAQIKEEKSVPGATFKYFGSPKSSGSGMPASSSTGVQRSNSVQSKESSKRSETSSAFGILTGPGIPSSTNQLIKSESGVPNSSLKHFESSRNSTLSSSSRLLGSPGKSGSLVPLSTSESSTRQGGAAGGRKRWREDRNSAHIFDFFQRISHSPTSSSSSSSSVSREHREKETGTEVPSAGLLGTTSSSALTVNCPVCQSKVLESQINHHLDTCLM
ncbi:SprT-like domain-containing protein Spartan [Bagarius yarrelli]|uniref:DNA-dependent metalloprotease SPRTN n=1 Tax=Bagarius yarrelli TaxID=175774 RepID=A0A556TZB3_BAGYA|nr:SprT-like domain-containing protein Spartan [Bagarius yarrelli]